MTTDALDLSEIGREGASGLNDVLVRALGSDPVSRYVEQMPLTWEVVADGGWDLLGAPESADGAGATLRDLVEVARVWGRYITPSPFVVTMMSKRWSAAARDHQGPVTVAIPTRGSTASVAPFGALQGVKVLASSSEGGGLTEPKVVRDDDFAPSLRLAECSTRTQWTGPAASELRVVWAAEASGCAAQMLVAAVAYAQEREQFGQPIARFQAIKHQMANAYLLAEQAETAAIMASQVPTRVVDATRFAFDASLRVIEMATQVHGGMGFTWEMGIHVYMRHVITLRELAEGIDA